MSLSNSERDITAREFEENLFQTGLGFEEFREKTGLPEPRFLEAFMVFEGCDPVDLWLIRDLLEVAAKKAGGELVEFEVLTDDVRADASEMFGVEDRRASE